MKGKKKNERDSHQAHYEKVYRALGQTRVCTVGNRRKKMQRESIRTGRKGSERKGTRRRHQEFIHEKSERRKKVNRSGEGGIQ